MYRGSSSGPPPYPQLAFGAPPAPFVRAPSDDDPPSRRRARIASATFLERRDSLAVIGEGAIVIAELRIELCVDFGESTLDTV